MFLDQSYKQENMFNIQVHYNKKYMYHLSFVNGIIIINVEYKESLGYLEEHTVYSMRKWFI